MKLMIHKFYLKKKKLKKLTIEENVYYFYCSFTFEQI